MPINLLPRRSVVIASLLSLFFSLGAQAQITIGPSETLTNTGLLNQYYGALHNYYNYPKAGE